MTLTRDVTARQLGFGSTHSGRAGPRPSALPTGGPVPLCAVCGRARARLTLPRERGHEPVKLCLRCHHAVMQQRKQRRMLRAELPAERVSATGRRHHIAGDAGLIVPRESELSPTAKYDTLSHRRRRAQVAARRALESEPAPMATPNLFDRAS